jgi:hypothetical protein
MRHAAQLLAQRVIATDARGLEPEVGDRPGHHVHLHAKRRHRELMQDVERAQLDLDGLVQRQVQLGSGHDDIVLALRIAGIQRQRIVGTREARVAPAEAAVRTREAITEVPLLADHLDQRGAVRHGHEPGPDDEAWGQQRNDSCRRDDREPPLELLVLGFVFGALPASVAVADDDVGHEQVDENEGGPGDPECQVHGAVHHRPVGRNGREPPRAQHVEQHGAHHQQDQYHC